MNTGQIKGDELYLRCPYCGDSQRNLKKAHLAVNLISGLFKCNRCQQGGKLPPHLLLRLADLDLTDETLVHQEIPFVIEGPGSQRFSALKRYKTLEGSDVFHMFSPSTEGFYQSGLYMRKDGKSRIYGQSGLSWRGAPGSLSSDEDHPLRLVEGPYDVLTGNDVCFFGFFPQRKLSWLKGHSFYLVPDGDAWLKPNLTAVLLKRIDYCIDQHLGILGVIYLPQGADPDDQLPEDIIPIRYFKRKLWKKRSSSSKARQALANLL